MGTQNHIEEIKLIYNIIKELYQEIKSHIDKKMLDQANELARKAVDKTHLYISGKEQDMEKEQELFQIWSEVSHKLRGIDKNLSIRALDKSRYWLSPTCHSDISIENSNIELKKINKDLLDALTR